MPVGIVYIVGAGPGDPRLITLLGLECLKKSDVVVYDRLSNSRLLSYAKPEAEFIYAGKSPEKHCLKQDEINEVLAEKAKAGKIVTRLKGGDPFVFGRGGEEAEFLTANGIPFEIIPGITAGISVPAYAGIPVTHRDYSSSVVFITGNEEPGKSSCGIDWDKLSTGCSTIVFYMGMANLPLIVENLVQHGRSIYTPAAVIQWGTRPEQKTVQGTLKNIVGLTKEAKIGHPAIVVVGEVVNLRERLKWFENKPLFGKRILVTRARNQASEFSHKIENLGGEPWESPAIEIVNPDDCSFMDRAIQEIDSYDWLVLTSVNGVKAFMDRMKILRQDIRKLGQLKIVAVGPKTKEEIERYGIFCEFTPDEFVAEAMLEIFGNIDIKGQRFLLPRADIARKILPDTLRDMGAIVDDVIAYKTVEGKGDSALLTDMLQSRKIDVVTFTSSSTVKNFIKKIGRNKIHLLKDVTIACIGPVTSETAREYGLNVDVQAEPYTIDGLIQGILKFYNKYSAEV